LKEVQTGTRRESVINSQTLDSLSTDDKHIWQTLRKELEEAGVTSCAFNANKDFIHEWFTEAVANGAFKAKGSPLEEQELISKESELSGEQEQLAQEQKQSGETSILGLRETASSKQLEGNTSNYPSSRVLHRLIVTALSGGSLTEPKVRNHLGDKKDKRLA
jgi:hypothetical protein